MAVGRIYRKATERVAVVVKEVMIKEGEMVMEEADMLVVIGRSGVGRIKGENS